MRRFRNMNDRQVEKFPLRGEMGSRNGQRLPAHLVHIILREGSIGTERRYYTKQETRDDRLHRHIPKGKEKRR